MWPRLDVGRVAKPAHAAIADNRSQGTKATRGTEETIDAIGSAIVPRAPDPPDQSDLSDPSDNSLMLSHPAHSCSYPSPSIPPLGLGSRSPQTVTQIAKTLNLDRVRKIQQKVLRNIGNLRSRTGPDAID